MKAIRFALIAIFAVSSFSLWAANPVEDDIVFIVKPYRIYLLTDEAPVFPLKVYLMDQNGAIHSEKIFDSRTEEWFLELPALPTGDYSLFMNGKVVKRFHRKAVVETRRAVSYP